MAVSIKCPKCNTSYKMAKTPEDERKIRCSKCGHAFSLASIRQTIPTPIPERTHPPVTGAATVKLKKTKQAPDLTGMVLGGCRIEHLLGQGGMGAVYRAHHEALDIPVAVKVLPQHFAAQDTTFVERFVREARSAAKLKHHNIVGVLNVGCEHDTNFIIMDFVDGCSVEDKLREHGALPSNEASDIIQQVCAALEVARKNNIIHRDIKPDNIMLTKDGVVKLADLGLAKNVEEDSHVTMTGMAMGTPHYMAPEQAADASRCDHRSDIYSLGCTFYRMLTGIPPYEGGSLYSILRKHEHDPIPDPHATCTAVPQPLAGVVMKMMAKAPDDRYQTTGDVAADLSSIAHGGIPAGIATPISEEVTRKVPKRQASVRRPEHKRKRQLWPFAAAAIGILVMGAIFLNGKGDEEYKNPERSVPQLEADEPDEIVETELIEEIEDKPKAIAKVPERRRKAEPQPIQDKADESDEWENKARANVIEEPQEPEANDEDKERARLDALFAEIFRRGHGQIDRIEVSERVRKLPNYHLFAAQLEGRGEPLRMLIGKTNYLRTPAGESFFRIGDLLRSFDHPQLPKVFELEDTGEYFGGLVRMLPKNTKKLDDYLASVKGEAKQRHAVLLLMQALELMQHYEERGVLHRAISPSRLRVTEKGKLYLWDFKYALLKDDEDWPQVKLPHEPEWQAPELQKEKILISGQIFMPWGNHLLRH